MTVGLGTPANVYELIVDTGSTLTYVPCVSCGASCGDHNHGTFDPDASETYVGLGLGLGFRV